MFQYFGKMVSDSSQKAMTFFDKILNSLPGFSDVFDEETFLAFAFVFVCMAFGVGLFLSQNTCINSSDPADRPRRKPKLVKGD